MPRSRPRRSRASEEASGRRSVLGGWESVGEARRRSSSTSPLAAAAAPRYVRRLRPRAARDPSDTETHPSLSPSPPRRRSRFDSLVSATSCSNPRSSRARPSRNGGPKRASMPRLVLVTCAANTVGSPDVRTSSRPCEGGPQSALSCDVHPNIPLCHALCVCARACARATCPECRDEERASERDKKAPDADFFARPPVGSNSNKTARSSVSLI